MNDAGSLRVRVQLPLDRFRLDVDFRAARHFTGVFGASGCGKTSLLEAIAGLRHAAQGTIALGDTVWLESPRGIRLPPEQRDIGYVPQEGLLFPHKNTRQNLLAGVQRACRRQLPVHEIFDRAVALLELEPLLDRHVDTLSGGERQRVALGRALCSGPRLLLLDEPFASLDLALRRRVLPFLRRVREEFAMPMLFVSHNPNEVQALCDELIVLRDGAIIAQGDPRAVLTDPAVFPIAEHEGFENVLPGVVLEAGSATSVVRVGSEADGVRLVAPAGGGGPGEEVLLSVPARDVLIARRRPEAISARNVLPGSVVSVRRLDPWRLVTVRLTPSAPDLVVEVTAEACGELTLEPGAGVFLVLKTSAFSVYGGQVV